MRIVFRSFLLGAACGAVAMGAASSDAPLSKMGVTSTANTLSLPMQIALAMTLMVVLPACAATVGSHQKPPPELLYWKSMNALFGAPAR